MKYFVAFVMVLAVFEPAIAQKPVDANLKIDVRGEKKVVSPLLFGLFLEEYNHCIDGGLYAELIKNRSFEDADTLSAWTIENKGPSGDCGIVSDNSLDSNNKKSFRFVLNGEASHISISNSGYWGLTLESLKKYECSFYARMNSGFKGQILVQLSSAEGTVLASEVITPDVENWKKYAVKLVPQQNVQKGKLVIKVQGQGNLLMDMVSLFPAVTFKNRVNGARKDIAKLLYEMKPSFVRFPGGCDVEGDLLQNAFRWKNTIGPVATRPGRNCMWGYRVTDGFGTHEYLQLIEDLGAEPVFVINAGMSCQARATRECVPMDSLHDWVQDALDVVEYANGPVTSKWGKMRALNGHKKPFNLKFLEIGNENSGPEYEKRYAHFFDAVRQKYPGIQIIANSRVSSRPMDMVAEHYYNSPEWFTSQSSRYDTVNANTPKVQLGEYSVYKRSGKGNLKAALAEAAFMTGLERNGDKVAMACFGAPMSNSDDPNSVWEPNMIYLNSDDVYGTPSYYVQKLFSIYKGNETVPFELNFTDTSLMGSFIPFGSMGLTSEGSIQCSNVKIVSDGKDITRSALKWSSRHQGKFSGAVKHQLPSGDTCVSYEITDYDSLDNYKYEVEIDKVASKNGLYIYFRILNENTWYRWHLGYSNNRMSVIEKCVGDTNAVFQVTDEVSKGLSIGASNRLRLIVNDGKIQCYINDTIVHDIVDKGVPALTGVVSKKGRQIILKVVNVSDNPYQSTVTFAGGVSVDKMMEQIRLAGSNGDENSFTRRQIRPIAEQVPIQLRHAPDASFLDYLFPPRSLSILVLKEK